MNTALVAAENAKRRDTRSRWLLATPALMIILLAAIGPLFIMLAYSFMTKGEYGDVKLWQFSLDGWLSVFLEKDIFDGTLSVADAHLLIFWRSVKLSLITTLLTLMVGFPTAYFISTRPQRTRELWLFLITVPFWTNLLIRTFAILEVIRNEGLINGVLMNLGIIDAPLQILFTDTAILVGMVYVYLPLMVLPLYASMEKLDFRLVEAGYDLYATPFRGLAQDHHSAGQARSHSRFNPCFHSFSGRLRHAKRARRRQEFDVGQSDRIAVWPGARLAIGGGAFNHVDADRDGCLAGLCAQCRFVRGAAWLSGLTFAASPGSRPSP